MCRIKFSTNLYLLYEKIIHFIFNWDKPVFDKKNGRTSLIIIKNLYDLVMETLSWKLTLELSNKMFDVDYKIVADFKSKNRNYFDWFVQKLYKIFLEFYKLFDDFDDLNWKMLV